MHCLHCGLVAAALTRSPGPHFTSLVNRPDYRAQLRRVGRLQLRVRRSGQQQVQRLGLPNTETLFGNSMVLVTRVAVLVAVRSGVRGARAGPRAG
eukprot:3715458-Pyramimonas_sp.AAC.1